MYIKKKEDTIIQKVFQMLAYIINTQYSKSVMLILFLKMQLMFWAQSEPGYYSCNKDDQLT